MTGIRKLLVLLLLSALPLVTQAESRVLSALPILHGLNQALLEGTDIEALYLPPRRLPVNRLGYWLQHKSQASLDKLDSVSAVVTVESVWPQYSLYPLVRGQNIHVVPVDAIREIRPEGAQVRLTPNDLSSFSYIWMVPDNLIVMSQIVARDFALLWPDQAPKVKQNQKRLQHQIREYGLQLEQLLLDQEVTHICIDDQQLEPLALATYLPLEPLDQCHSDGLVIAKKALEGLAAPVWIPNTYSKPLKIGLNDWLQLKLKELTEVLHPDPAES